MGSADEAVVLAFNAAINRRDLSGLGRLMADGHRFIDTAGNTFAGKPACLEAWRGFFTSFPDYRNVFDNVRSSSGGIVEVHGRSECSIVALAGPARWRAVVADGLVVEWRVFDATGLDRSNASPRDKANVARHGTRYRIGDLTDVSARPAA